MQANTKELLVQSGKALLISLVIVGSVGWKPSDSSIKIPNREVAKEKLVLIPTEGKWFLDRKAYSGFAISYFPNGKKKEQTGFINGKRQGLSQEWYENGLLKKDITYLANRKDGRSQSFNEKGVLVSESNFINGVVHGVQRKWYPSGKVFKEMNINMGKEDGMQKVWWENGKLYVNYEAKNGRIFGLKRSALCYELENEVVQK
ncbi:MORN repeat variant [Spirosomataceae bacterium TFI 002]|nr:MORN repeat variant [Spirosomataceae bacterium TFI 002]